MEHDMEKIEVDKYQTVSGYYYVQWKQNFPYILPSQMVENSPGIYNVIDHP